MQRMNKEFEDKYTTLRNRIEILKREDQIYKNQLNNIKRKERKEQMIQADKIKIKLELSKIKEEQDKELEKRKERIHRIKERIKTNMEEKKNENISKKKRKYQSALNDKYLIKCIIEQINNQQNNKKNYQHEKVRQYYNEYETNKIKKHLLKENKQIKEYENNIKKLREKEETMKKKCDELESVEKQCLEKLNETKENNLRYIENTIENVSKYSYVYYYKKGKMRNLNRSMELESYSNNKKVGDSKSVLSCSAKNIKSKIDKKDNITTEYTQSSSINIVKDNKNNKKQNFKSGSAVKRRNKDTLKENNKISKSFINIKERNKTNKALKKLETDNMETINKSSYKKDINKNILKNIKKSLKTTKKNK